MKNQFKSGLLALLCVSTLGQAQLPPFSSYPSASSVIFLDFDGHTTNGTSWNYTGPIVSAPSGLSDAKITEIYNRISEDYRPFNINITTDSTKYWNAPVISRMRIVLSITSAWYGSAGGVAFVNSFTWGDNTPCFVFTALLNNNVKQISEASSHEAGHTLGLRHQSDYDANCNKISDYHYGIGSGEIGWAPIMGVGYYKNFTLWHNGANSFGCNSFQSDLDIISGLSNGFGFRTDDHTELASSSTIANYSGNSFTVNGVIERSGDKDMIQFLQTDLGTLKLDAIPYSVGIGNAGSDLDMQITLLNGDQVVLGSYNPGTVLNSVMDTMLSPGVYYLRVEGKGNLYAPEYASLGSYALQGNFTPENPLPLRKLELTGSLQQDKHALNWIIDADEQVESLIIEISTDGRNYKPLTQITSNALSFVYKPDVPATTQYRLNVTFDNGRRYYSNIIVIRKADAASRPQLVSTIIYNGNINVSSPGQYEYMIFDLNGRILNRGRIANGINNIKESKLINGLYIIRFANSEEQWTEKFVSY